jgi:hypothetical protein
MDISVSHLNNRLALQLPKELPLGLVFVLGRVENLRRQPAQSPTEPPLVTFDLIEKGHHLRCRLSKRAATEMTLQEGDLIRAGGHLSFDPRRADYFLLARDVDIVTEVETTSVEPKPRLERSGLASILADIKRRSEAVQTQPAELPTWVQHMAPPELETASQGNGAPKAAEVAEATETGEVVEPAEAAKATAAAEVTGADGPIADGPIPPPIDNRFVDFASKAMESKEEVELTPDLLNRLQAKAPQRQRPAGGDPYAVPSDKPTTPTPRHRTTQSDWLSNVLLLTLIALLLVIVAIMLFSWLS